VPILNLSVSVPENELIQKTRSNGEVTLADASISLAATAPAADPTNKAQPTTEAPETRYHPETVTLSLLDPLDGVTETDMNSAPSELCGMVLSIGRMLVVLPVVVVVWTQ
jgi:hypothetical protein